MNNHQSSSQVLYEIQIREWGKHRPVDIPEVRSGAKEE
jgi:hypothetical protein